MVDKGSATECASSVFLKETLALAFLFFKDIRLGKKIQERAYSPVLCIVSTQ